MSGLVSKILDLKFNFSFMSFCPGNIPKVVMKCDIYLLDIFTPESKKARITKYSLNLFKFYLFNGKFNIFPQTSGGERGGEHWTLLCLSCVNVLRAVRGLTSACFTSDSLTLLFVFCSLHLMA